MQSWSILLVKKKTFRVLTSGPPLNGRTVLYDRPLLNRKHLIDRKSRTLADVVWFQGGSAFTEKS